MSLFLSQILGQFIQSSLFFIGFYVRGMEPDLLIPLFVNDSNTFKVDIRSMIVKA